MIEYWFNAESYGGVIPELLYVCKKIDESTYAALQIDFMDRGLPRVRDFTIVTLDTLVRHQFTKIDHDKAHMLFASLIDFVDELLRDE